MREDTLRFESLGLKTRYSFKETHVPTSRQKDHILQQLRGIVAPAVTELEERRLINGFHHIVHTDIDLRLSCEDWAVHGSEIGAVLVRHSIDAGLKDWGPMPPERYGGPLGVLLCYNNLEFNSRLCLALAEVMHGAADAPTLTSQRDLCPHQWVHYLCNQSGCLNAEQILFEVNDAFRWLQALIGDGLNPDAIALARDLIAKMRRVLEGIEKSLPACM